ncbi:integrase family protein [Halomonas sp. CKK8]|uniref:tyrosine-type recombinase/integrase n=1 Tax=Halomonas sp. CKK8 TaxID=3036127 RepID=UPI002414E74B|nr:integrase family protein [Halomonas sp. CKK8]WFM71827.1 integrase family protein [Halomonas sp. CKK8]
MKIKISKTTVERLTPPETGERLVWDSALPGFGVRVVPSGTRSYIVQRRVNGKQRRLTLGRHGVLTAELARKRAQIRLGEMADGTDPVHERKREQALAVTLRQVVESYIRDRRDLKPRSIRDIRRHLDHNFPAWADRPVVEITRDKVLKRFRDVSDSSHAQANQAFRVLRALLNYARAAYRTPDDHPVLPENPVDVLAESKMWHRPRARNTYVPLEKVGAWWSAVCALREDPALSAASRASADLVALLALTGLRLGEASALRWEQVDLEDDSIWLADTKNRTDITLPLSSEALAVLEGRCPIDAGYVFPSRSGKSHIKEVRGPLAKLEDATGVKVSAHDLRRTFRAVAGACHVELWRCKALMNHAQNQDVTLANYSDLEDVRYLRPDAQKIADYLEKKRQEFEAGNVVPLEAVLHG